MRNTGTSAWGPGYRLVFRNGEQMGAPSWVDVPATAPNGTADLTVSMVAPSTNGHHKGVWQLRNPSGTYFGPEIYIDVEVRGGATGGGSITVFEATPASPSSASSVHLVGRLRYFSEYRSVRFVLNGEVHEQPNIITVGDLIQISYDWNTSSVPRGTYPLYMEVATKNDPDWSRAERRYILYTLSGAPAPTGRPPDRPALKEPFDWYLKDASGANAPVRMCVYPASDPDGDAVEYYFELNGGAQSSGWTSSTCWEPTLAPFGYAWRVKARGGGLESDWSPQTWHFNVAGGGVYIGDHSFYYPYDDDTHLCVLVTYDGITGPEVKGFINLAAGGSESGEWKQLDHYGPNTTPDCTSANVHGFWIRAFNYVQGTHAIRITAFKPDSGTSDIKTTSITFPYLRPQSPLALAPSTELNNGTWWNNPSVRFLWERGLRTDISETLRISTQSDVWNDPSPLVSQTIAPSLSEYTVTLGQDYNKLYWALRATNSEGSGYTPVAWFGLDRVKPTCTVEALPAAVWDTVQQVRWSGTDNAGGVRSYDVQYRPLRSTEWIDWQIRVPYTRTYEIFTGFAGQTYEFRCRAVDNAGNTGDWPAAAQAFTKLDPGGRPPSPWWNASWALKRNIVILNNMPSIDLPIGYPVRLRFDSTTSPRAAEVYAASLSSPKCNDLRVVLEDATELDRLVETCSTSLIELSYRAQVTVTAGGSNGTGHQLYYANAEATAPPSDSRKVWNPEPDANTVGLWYFSEGSGATTVDLSGHGNSGSVGSLNWTDGKFGSALFNADTSWGPRGVTVGASSSLAVGAFSFEAFVKADPIFWGSIASQGAGTAAERWVLIAETNGDAKFQVWPWAGAGSVQVLSGSRFITGDSKWHHLAITFDGGNSVKFYRDGSLFSEKTLSDTGLNLGTSDLFIGSGQNEVTSRFLGAIDQVRLSNVVRTEFSHGAFGLITTEPSVQVGAPVAPPEAGTPDLAVLSLASFPNPTGGVLVQAQIQNQGNLDTLNGFFTDVYVNHLPTGSGYYTGSIQFWVNDPIAPGASVTLTSAISGIGALRAMGVASMAAGEEVTGTLYAQVDSTGAVSEAVKVNNIYGAGVELCLASDDAFEPDETPAAAKPIALGDVQRHNVSRPGDHDWVQFTAQAGRNYVIATSALSSAADTYLYLYGPDGTTLLAANDDYGGALTSRIEWTAPSAGTYYLLVQHWNPNVGGCGTSYSLSVAREFHMFLPLVFRN